VDLLLANPGSSSLKLTWTKDGERIREKDVELAAPGEGLDRALRGALSEERDLSFSAVGARVVHGGDLFHGPCRVAKDTIPRIRSLSGFAPLHQEPSAHILESFLRLYPDLPLVASFDTVFHATLEPEAYRYAIPGEWTRRGIRKFGFHGLSFAYLSHRVPELLGEKGTGRLVALHLGNGSSACAIEEGRSVDTTMGLTPLDGLVMGTRPGRVDPGVLLALMEEGVSAKDLSEGLWLKSGLSALSPEGPDFRRVWAAFEGGDERAILAVNLTARRVAQAVAEMAVAMGGIDILAFTGGIGEHAWEFRQKIADRLGFLGVGLDTERNRSGTEDREIGSDGARVRSVVVAAREDWTLDRDVRFVLGCSPVTKRSSP
jgi:acetate kinase